MPNVIDASGKVVRDIDSPAFSMKTLAISSRSSIARCTASLRTAAPGQRRRSSAMKCGRRTQTVAAEGHRPRASGFNSFAAMASRRRSVRPQPRSFVESLNKKERRVAFIAALADRFRNDAVTLLETADFSIGKTAGFAKLLFGSAKAARVGPTTLIVCRRGEAHAAEIERVSRNLTRVGITDDGALDVKDVLRFERLLFTTAAYDALTQRLAEKREQADGRA